MGYSLWGHKESDMTEQLVPFYIYIMEKEMTAHSSILAWEIPRTEETGKLQFMGSQRIGHN